MVSVRLVVMTWYVFSLGCCDDSKAGATLRHDQSFVEIKGVHHPAPSHTALDSGYNVSS
jgi:hypothetical protein